MGMQAAVAGIAVNAQGNGFVGAFNPQHGRIAARAYHRVGLYLVVIAAIDAFLAGNVGRSQQVGQDLRGLSSGRGIAVKANRRHWGNWGLRRPM